MSKILPVSWANLVTKLRTFGFEDPCQGGEHPYMIKGDLVLKLPHPHQKEIGVDLLVRIWMQANIEKRDWLEVA